MNQKYSSLITPLVLALSYGYLFLFPQEASAAVVHGLALCGTVVLPSLLPFFVLTNCVVSSGILERALEKLHISRMLPLGESGASAMVLGLLGGYPLGAKALASLVQDNALSEQDASAYLPFCNNGGIALFLSMIGNKLFGSMQIGILLYGIHILSALALSLFLRPSRIPPQASKKKHFPTKLHFVAAVQDAAGTALTVCAFIVIFSVITQAVRHLPALSLLGAGMLELSGGCYAAASASLPIALRAALCSLFAGWGGVCVHAQTAAVLDGLHIRFRQYLFIKLLHGFLASFLTLFCFAVFFRNFLFIP